MSINDDKNQLSGGHSVSHKNDDNSVNDKPRKTLTLSRAKKEKAASTPTSEREPSASSKPRQGREVVIEIKKPRRDRRSSSSASRKNSDQSTASQDGGLTDIEREARRRAVALAQKAALAEQEAAREAEVLAQKKREREQREAAQREEEAKKATLEALQRQEKEQKERSATQSKPELTDEKKPLMERSASTEEKRSFSKEPIKTIVKQTKSKRPVENPARKMRQANSQGKKKLSHQDLVQTLSENEQEENARLARSMASINRKKEKERARDQAVREKNKKIYKEVILPEMISVQELASRMAERSADVIKTLFQMGVMVTKNQSVDADTAELVVAEMGHTSRRAEKEMHVSELQDFKVVEMEGALRQARPPVVTVMGHVDHGKTSLLDALRLTDVIAGEAGGITQHIGAYQVTIASGHKITFLDTPGHAAFSQMRSRGAHVTDIVLLVVAADDGVMPQTVEAINHAKAANVPIIVVVNKIDKPGADPDNVLNHLLQYEVVAEKFGGDVQVVEISAKQRLNLDKLEEAIVLQSELLDLNAVENIDARGVVIESHVSRSRGPVATILLQQGALAVGQVFVSGTTWGKVRLINNDRGVTLKTVQPSMPVEILGFEEVSSAGQDFIVVGSEAEARNIAEARLTNQKEKAAQRKSRSLEDIFAQKDGKKLLPIVLKGDVHGSVEAIVSALASIEHQDVGVAVIHSGVGEINESDIALAEASNALVYGFNVRANVKAKKQAESISIRIAYFSIIYELIQEIKSHLGLLLPPTVEEKILGYAEVREVFNISKVGTIAGCFITEGKLLRSSKVRLLRNNVVVYEGLLKTLKRMKEDVKEVGLGYECGVAIENFNDIKIQDRIECFEVTEKAQTLD